MKPYDRNGNGNGIDDEDLFEEQIPDLGDDETNDNKNEGEGSRTAARRYNRDVREFVAGDHVAGAAREAVRAVDSEVGARDAVARERAAKVGRPTLFERGKGLVRSLYHRAMKLIPRRRSAARAL